MNSDLRELPWISRREKNNVSLIDSNGKDVKSGEFVVKTLFAEFALLAEKKIDAVLTKESLEKQISKSLQRGEDAIFDQLLTALGSVAEHCLPSLLQALFAWYERQLSASNDFLEQKGLKINLTDSQSKATTKSTSGVELLEKSEQLYLLEKRDLCVEFVFCLFLIEILKQLPLHPGHEELVNYIENLAFKHFKFREGTQNNPNIQNINIIADLYAEVIGVLAQARFQSVRKRFMTELKELRSKDPSVVTTQSIVSLLMGMKFFRIKMVPIEEFEASFEFMHECANYFIEIKDKDIKHALAGLFVEVLVPVAATVKNEVNVPCLKNFVELLYPLTLDLCVKKKHTLSLFPLVTCILCVSQKQFFLKNWHYFLSICLSHLKNRDSKMSRVALESLYRLLWAYMIRIKCESNTATHTKLQSIVNSLFPKGSKAVVPRDTPLNIFVKIIQFIAQERLDFAMKGIVYDLLSVDRPIKVILAPERMSIGLRAFLVVADSLQQKDGEPPMPRTAGVMPSGNTLRVKKTFLNKMLTEKMAKNIGVNDYYPHVRKSLNDILRALDIQFGRPLMLTTVQNINKEPDDMITGERKPKIDLFRTCIAAIPRLIPDGMSRQDLIDILSRLTVHMDEEMRGLAFQSLQNIINDFAEWREDVIEGFVNFLLHEVNDTFPQLLDNGLRMLLQLLTSWKTCIQANIKAIEKSLTNKQSHTVILLHQLEAIGLVMLCSCRQPSRRLAANILKETRFLLKLFSVAEETEEPVLDVIDRVCPQVVENCLQFIPANEKSFIIASSFNIDLHWLADRNGSVWINYTNESENEETQLAQETSRNDDMKMNVWSACLIGFMSEVSKKCTIATFHSWSLACQKLNILFPHIETTPINDNRASVLLRGTSSNTSKKSTNERCYYLALWKNYLMFACNITSSCHSQSIKSNSQDLSSSPDSMASERSSENKSPMNRSNTASSLFNQALALIKSEHSDIRNAAIFGLSHINCYAVKELMEELVPYIRDAIDRNKENSRKRKQRELLRIHLGYLLELLAERGVFGLTSSSFDRDADGLNNTFVEYIDGIRLYLENENDKENASIQEIRMRFCGFLHHLIRSFSIENRNNLFSRDLRSSLFYLFASWCYKYSSCFLNYKLTYTSLPEFELIALKAMSAVLCCGSVFDNKCLSENSPVFQWLNQLLLSEDENIRNLGQETIVLLLEFNPNSSSLLDWVLDCCYTQSSQVADFCFNAIATIFSLQDYPCDQYISIINVTLMNVGCPRANIHETAFHLLQILDARFFGLSKNLEFNFNIEPSDATEVDKALESSEGNNLLVDNGIVQLRKKNFFRNEKKSYEPLLLDSYPCSQIKLSERMAKLHADLTMTFFSEITCRFQTARPSICRNMLYYLKPWLLQMELVDPHLMLQSNTPVTNHLSLNNSAEGEIKGWGCAEATEMVLNNLFYLMVKFGDEYPKEIEELWYSLLCCCPNNIRVIIRYLFIIIGLAPTEFLPYAKRVILYMARAGTECLVEEMIFELQTVENLNCVIERTETPPFFRITHVRKENGHLDEETVIMDNFEGSNRASMNLEQGTLHTKRHSTESSSERLLNHCKNQSQTSNGSSISKVKNDRVSIINEDLRIVSFSSPNEKNFPIFSKLNEKQSSKTLYSVQPYPFPMPEFGGYYAPLNEFLPDTSQPVIGFHRCNLALMLLCDLVVDEIPIDWTPHLPIMLHVLFLGLDHPKTLVHEHCKQLLLNLLIVCTQHDDNTSIAKILLNNKTSQMDYGLNFNPVISKQSLNFNHSSNERCQDFLFDNVSQRVNMSRKAFEMSSNPSLNETWKDNLWYHSDDNSDNCSESSNINENELNRSINFELLIKYIIDFLSSKKNSALWNCEDITAKVWSIRSASQMAHFLDHILLVFKSVVGNNFEERWAEVALQLALSCSSRHYAGRSLQIFRSLKVPINSRMLSDILSRLVETVAEQGEDMQGYVSELMLTLESAIDSMDFGEKLISDYVTNCDSPRPNINLNSKETLFEVPMLPTAPLASPSSSQSTLISGSLSNSDQNAVIFKHENLTASSKSVSLFGQNLFNNTGYRKRVRSHTESDVKMNNKTNLLFSLSHSRSDQSLQMLGELVKSPEDRTTLLAQFFWISVAMLETDYEHEFLLTLRLLDKILSRLFLEKNEMLEKVEKIMFQSKWTHFPGVHAMLLKGCSSPATFKATILLLHQMTPLLNISIIDPTETTDSFPYNVIALLPYMLANYDNPNSLCITTAKNFAQWCTGKSKNLDHLATVMTLYSKKSFSKESFQWTRCVVKYLYDAYPHTFPGLVTFLVEVMEKGATSLNSQLISILHCILHYMDITSISYPLNSDLYRIAHKYIEGPQWKDSLKVLKLVVTRSSTLAAAPSYNNPNFNQILSVPYSSNVPPDCISITSGASFADSEFGIKRELPGRTIEFSFDTSQTPIVGRHYLSEEGESETHKKSSEKNEESNEIFKKENSNSSPRRSLSYNHSFNEANMSNWKRPWLSQSRTRERLIGLLRSFGKSMGLPKSPSVIFSQTSDIVERQSSMGSSTEEISITNNDVSGESKLVDNENGDQFGLFKDFDFLEYELESQEGEGMDNFNWGVRRRSLSNIDDTAENDFRAGSPSQIDILQSLRPKDEVSSDDEKGSVSPSFDGSNELSISNLYSNN